MLYPILHIAKKDDATNELYFEMHTEKHDIKEILSENRIKQLHRIFTDYLENNTEAPKKFRISIISQWPL